MIDVGIRDDQGNFLGRVVGFPQLDDVQRERVIVWVDDSLISIIDACLEKGEGLEFNDDQLAFGSIETRTKVIDNHGLSVEVDVLERDQIRGRCKSRSQCHLRIGAGDIVALENIEPFVLLYVSHRVDSGSHEEEQCRK